LLVCIGEGQPSEPNINNPAELQKKSGQEVVKRTETRRSEIAIIRWSNPPCAWICEQILNQFGICCDFPVQQSHERVESTPAGMQIRVHRSLPAKCRIPALYSQSSHRTIGCGGKRREGMRMNNHRQVSMLLLVGAGGFPRRSEGLLLWINLAG
jgi:hypothetical protein